MPVMEKPEITDDGIIGEKEAKKVVRYLGLMSKERKALAKIEKALKDSLKQFMRKKGLPKLIATDGSTATLDEQERKKWDYVQIATALEMEYEELEEQYCSKVIGERLTCRVPK